MKSSLVFRTICRLLIASIMLVSFQSAQAGIIGTTPALAGAEAERNAVLSVAGRAEVADQLQAMGLDRQAAQERVAALSDEEVHTLASKLETLPAGANSNGWTIAAVILVAALIYYVYAWK